MTKKLSKTPLQLAAELDRATRALTRAGYTMLEGAEEWKPPLGPSSSPLLDRIDLLTFLLRELRDGVEGEWCFPDNLDERIADALAGKLPERPDTEWTDGDNQAGNPASSSQFLSIVDAWTAGDYAKPTLGDYRELQAQHDQVQSRLKAALDALREAKTYARWESEQYIEAELEVPAGLAKLLATIDALLAGQVPAPAVPEGWQLVPVKPTPEMRRAAMNLHNDTMIYHAMLAAAPKPEAKP